MVVGENSEVHSVAGSKASLGRAVGDKDDLLVEAERVTVSLYREITRARVISASDHHWRVQPFCSRPNGVAGMCRVCVVMGARV